MLPAKNRVDLEEGPLEVREDLQLHLVNRVDEVLPLVLAEPQPEDVEDEDQLPPAPSGEVCA